ncbi:hypothetical protein COOONC_09714 [Cooperia oncophora]
MRCLRGLWTTRKQLLNRAKPSTLTTTETPAPTTTTSSTTSSTTTPQPIAEIIPDNELEEEVVVVSDAIVIRLPHEAYVTGCNENAQCT